MRPGGGAPLRVLGWPAFSNRVEQPYNRLLYTHLRALGVEVEEYTAARALRGRASVLHLHWPERRVRDASRLPALARSGALLGVLDAFRARGGRVVWTVHNLAAHGGRYHAWLEPRFWRAFTRRLDGFIALSPSGAEAARERYPALRDVPGFVVPHGHYRGAYPDQVGRDAARRALALPPEARVLGFLGQVRPYKNVAHLLRTFARLPEPDLRLLVAGQPKPEPLAAELRALAEADSRVRLAPGFVPGDEVQGWLRAMDLAVLPYREILNSGSAILALSFDRPVLVPRRGAMEDLAAEVGPEWVRTFEGELTPEVLREALAWATEPGRPARPRLDALEWERVAALTLEAYRSVLARGRESTWDAAGVARRTHMDGS